MGEGNFGVVYEGFFSNGKSGKEQKWEKHVVLKRVKPHESAAVEMQVRGQDKVVRDWALSWNCSSGSESTGVEMQVRARGSGCETAAVKRAVGVVFGTVAVVERLQQSRGQWEWYLGLWQ